MTRVVAVTGAAGGIGTATVARFAQSGDAVCMLDVRADRLAERAAEIRARFADVKLLLIELDIKDRRAIERAHDEITATFGPVDVLVNNAGVFGQSPFLELSDEEIERVIDVNLLGTMRASQVFARAMVQRRAGRIVQVGSVAALKGVSQSAHYAASKAAVAALARCMALELGAHGVQVNVVHPGYIDTELLGASRNAIRAIAMWRVPEKRLGRPEEVAEAIWLMASAQTTFLTGAELVIDGGLVLG